MKEWQQLILIGVILVLGVMIIMFDSTDMQVVQLKQAVDSQLRANRAMRREIRELKGQIYAITHDDRYLEQLARNKLALSREGEEVYLFDDQHMTRERKR